MNKKKKKRKDQDLELQIKTNKKDTVGLFNKRPAEIESKKFKKKYIKKDMQRLENEI